jgi:hypothetical protein
MESHTPQLLPIHTYSHLHATSQMLNDDEIIVWALSKSFFMLLSFFHNYNCFVGSEILPTPGNKIKGMKRGRAQATCIVV